MIKIVIRCKSPDKTLSRLVLSHLDFSHPEKREGELTIFVSLVNFASAKRVLKSQGLKFYARPIGLLGLLWRYRRRWGLLAGGIICIFLFYLSTFYIWSVKIEGNGSVPEAQIRSTLERNGFYEGALKRRFDVNEAALAFLSDRAEFSFCSINVNGAVAHVQLVERVPTRYSESEQEPYNLVADCDGVVVRVEILNGQAMVKAGDTVHRGQILASGVIENTVNTAFRLRRAEGHVFARCSRELEFSVDLETVEKRYVSEKEFSRLFLLGRGVGPRRLSKDEGDYDIITSVERVEFLGREFPFAIEKTLCAFYEERCVTLDEKTALTRAHDLYRAWCSTELEGAVIEDEKFSHRIEDGRLVLTCYISAIEDITTRQKIEVL